MTLPTKKKTEEWTTRLILVGIGIYLLYTGPTNPSNLLIGIPFSVGPLIESIEFRNLFKLSINKVSGREVFQNKNIEAQQVFQGGTHYHGATEKRKPRIQTRPRNRSAKSEPEWLIDDDSEIEMGEFQDFEVELKQGDHLVGNIEAKGSVSAYLLGKASVRTFVDGGDFDYFWGREDFIRTKVWYKAAESRTDHLVVYNQEDEEDPISVKVKLRVESGKGTLEEGDDQDVLDRRT